MNGIRTDKFQSERPGRMTDRQLVDLVQDPEVGLVRTMATLSHQAAAALADGDIATAAYIETLKVSTLQR